MTSALSPIPSRQTQAVACPSSCCGGGIPPAAVCETLHGSSTTITTNHHSAATGSSNVMRRPYVRQLEDDAAQPPLPPCSRIAASGASWPSNPRRPRHPQLHDRSTRSGTGGQANAANIPHIVGESLDVSGGAGPCSRAYELDGLHIVCQHGQLVVEDLFKDPRTPEKDFVLPDWVRWQNQSISVVNS